MTYIVCFTSMVYRNDTTRVRKVFPLSILSPIPIDNEDIQSIGKGLIRKFPDIVASIRRYESDEFDVSSTAVFPYGYDREVDPNSKWIKELINESLDNMLIGICRPTGNYFTLSTSREWNISAVEISGAVKSGARMETTSPFMAVAEEVIYANRFFSNQFSLPRRKIIDLMETDDKLTPAEKVRVNSVCGMLYKTELTDSPIYMIGTVNDKLSDIKDRLMMLTEEELPDMSEAIYLLTYPRNDREDYGFNAYSRFPIIRVSSIDDTMSARMLYNDGKCITFEDCGMFDKRFKKSDPTIESRGIEQAFHRDVL